MLYVIISEKMSWRSQGPKCSTLLYLKKCPGDLKDMNVLRHYRCKYNCPGDLKDINVLLHYIQSIESTFICP